MIIRLQRSKPPGGPWLLATEYGDADFINPTPELEAMMEGESGYFYAERSGDGWEIGGRADEQRW